MRELIAGGKTGRHGTDNEEGLQKLFNILKAMTEYNSGFDYDVILTQHRLYVFSCL